MGFEWFKSDWLGKNATFSTETYHRGKHLLEKNNTFLPTLIHTLTCKTEQRILSSVTHINVTNVTTHCEMKHEEQILSPDVGYNNVQNLGSVLSHLSRQNNHYPNNSVLHQIHSKQCIWLKYKVIENYNYDAKPWKVSITDSWQKTPF